MLNHSSVWKFCEDIDFNSKFGLLNSENEDFVKKLNGGDNSR